MKVDLPSLVIGICALATFAVPIAWYHISEKMKIKKLSNKLTQFAFEEKLDLESQEIWGDSYALGLDQKMKKLLYIRLNEKHDQKKMIDLSEIKSCRISNGSRTIQKTKDDERTVTYIKLILHYRDPKKESTTLEIYDGDNGRTLTYEISIANKWARKINSSLKTDSKAAHKIPLL